MIMSSRFRSIALLSIFFAAAACSAERTGSEPRPGAQVHVASAGIQNLPAEPTCATCRLVFLEPFELTGAEADGGTPGGLAAVVRAANGKFAAVYWGSVQGLVYIYDAEGRFESTLGGDGSGPGEFRGIGNGLFVDGYILHAFDNRLGRHTLIDIRSGEFSSTPLSAGNVMNAAFPSDEAIVLSGRVHASREGGYPLHVFTPEGEWIRSFGMEEPQEDLSAVGSLVRGLASAGEGTFWSAPRREYLLEHWTVEGVRLRAFSGDRERFVPFEDGSYTQGRSPASQLSSISVDDAGLLWVVYSVAVPDWEDAIEPIPAREFDERTGRRYRILPGRRVRDHYLEVIDPQAGGVLVRSRLPANYYRFADAGTLVRGWEDYETGIARIAAIEVTLQR